MIYEYKGKRVVANNYEDASKLLKISKSELKKNGKEVKFVLKEDEEEIEDNYTKLGKNDSYSKKLQAMMKKDNMTDMNLHHKIAIHQLKNNPCAICGFDGVASAKCFHHSDSIEKKFEIRTGRIRFKHLQEEVAKCVLLCLCCHAHIHRVEECSDAEERAEMLKQLYAYGDKMSKVWKEMKDVKD